MIWWGGNVLALGLAAGIGAFFSFPINVPKNCLPKSPYRSVEGGRKAPMEFINLRSESVHVSFIDHEGREVVLMNLAAGKRVAYLGSPGYQWQVREASGDCLGLFTGDQLKVVME